MTKAFDKAPRTQTRTIEIGQQLADAKKLLRDRDIDYENSRLELGSTDKDWDHFSFELDEDRTYVAVGFSKSRGTITSVLVVMGVAHGKKYQVDMAAKSITLEDDGSYIVHFLPAKKGK
jgi:hypothetical protein